MEPSDFDKIISDRLHQKPRPHYREMQQNRLVIWSEVDRHLSKRSTAPWYWMSAAALLLLLSFWYVLNETQQQHSQALAARDAAITEIQNQYEEQLSVANDRLTKVTNLKALLEQMTKQVADLKMLEQVSVSSPVKPIYITDTVYVTEVRYVPQPESEVAENSEEQIIAVSEEPDSTVSTEVTQPAFMAIASSANKSQQQAFKLKFASFAQKKRNP